MVGLMRAILGMDRGARYRLQIGHHGTGLFREVFQTSKKAGHKKPGLNIGPAGIKTVPGLFSELFNVAASRPAQMTTEQRKDSHKLAFRQATPIFGKIRFGLTGVLEGADGGQAPLRRLEP
jgi:hypothetical protein